jgi:hypothetical protein
MNDSVPRDRTLPEAQPFVFERARDNDSLHLCRERSAALRVTRASIESNCFSRRSRRRHTE